METNAYRPTYRITVERILNGKPSHTKGDKARLTFDVPSETLVTGEAAATKTIALYIQSIGGKVISFD